MALRRNAYLRADARGRANARCIADAQSDNFTRRRRRAAARSATDTDARPYASGCSGADASSRAYRISSSRASRRRYAVARRSANGVNRGSTHASGSAATARLPEIGRARQAGRRTRPGSVADSVCGRRSRRLCRASARSRAHACEIGRSGSLSRPRTSRRTNGRR